MANIKVTKVMFGEQEVKCNSYTTIKDDFVSLFIEHTWIAVCPDGMFNMPVYVKIEKTVLNNTTSAIFNESFGCWGTGSQGHITISGLPVYQGATYFTLIISTDPNFAEPLAVQYQCNWINYATETPSEPEPEPIEPIIPLVPFEPIIPPIVMLEEEKTSYLVPAIVISAGVLLLIYLMTRKEKEEES